MRAAVLHGPDDLRVEETAEPEGEVVVRVAAGTACGTDVKMLRHGHRILGGYPSRFGHETAGVRLDTGERVFVGDSVACGECSPCRARRPQLCRAMTWVLGGFAEMIAAPAAALHPVPDGLDLAGAAMAEPLAACVHAVARADGADAAEAAGDRVQRGRGRRDALGEPAQHPGHRAADLRPPGPARAASAARDGVADEDALARVDPHAGGLVPEPARIRPEDPVAVAQHLHVGAARGRRLDPDHDLARGLGHLLHAQVVGAVQDRRAHPALTRPAGPAP